MQGVQLLRNLSGKTRPIFTQPLLENWFTASVSGTSPTDCNLIVKPLAGALQPFKSPRNKSSLHTNISSIQEERPLFHDPLVSLLAQCAFFGIDTSTINVVTRRGLLKTVFYQ